MITTHYLDGFQYSEDKIDFFPTAEGYVNVTWASGTPGGPQLANYNYVYNYSDHLGNIRLRYTKNPGGIGLRILEEDHYYPFGLKHQGYNNEHNIFEPGMPGGEPVVIVPVNPLIGDKYKYKFNGMEWQDEMGLDVYDFGARNYDPALGRFFVVDPMADFVNYQSSYVMADNNPVMYVDEYGFGILRVIKNLFSRASFGVKKLLSGNRCNCRKFQGESIGDAWAQPDFPNRKGNKRSKKNKIKTNVVTVETNAKRPEIGRLNINLMPMGIVEQDLVFSTSLLETTLMPIIPKPIKVEPNIVINNKKVILGQEYDMTIHFQLSRFLIETTTSNDKILNDLLKTLKDYPQLKILIKGNFMDDRRRTGDDIVNSLEGTMPIKEFQVKRAMAILKFLQANGVDSSRIKVDAGKIGSSASTTIIFTD